MMVEGSMRLVRVLLVVLLAIVWSGCSSTHWVHPSKKEEQLTYDWNKCERDWMNQMTTNPGVASMHDNPSIERQRMANCLQKKGWRKVEDD
jgi:hypothetical protein